MNSHEVFIHIHQGCFAGTGAIVRLPQCQWSKPDGYGKISHCITTKKHSKAKTVCTFLGIYCNRPENVCHCARWCHNKWSPMAVCHQHVHWWLQNEIDNRYSTSAVSNNIYSIRWLIFSGHWINSCYIINPLYLAGYVNDINWETRDYTNGKVTIRLVVKIKYQLRSEKAC